MKKNFDDGVQLYQQALDSIPDEHTSFRTVIHFNLGLLFLRADNMTQAKQSLELCDQNENQSLHTKAQKIIASIDEAASRNKKVRMAEKEAPPDFHLSEDSAKKINRSMRFVKNETVIVKGERCLHLIVYAETPMKLVTESLTSVPNFKSKTVATLDDKKVRAVYCTLKT